MKSTLPTLLLLATLATALPFTKSKNASTYTTNGSASDVQRAIDEATNGATVVLPSGNFSWTSGVKCEKAITIQGNGAVTITHAAGNANLLELIGTEAGHLVLAGIKFEPGNGTGRFLWVHEKGANAQTIIVHDCSFDQPSFKLICTMTWEAKGGLLYNDTFFSTDDGGGQGPGSGSECIQVRSPKPWYDADTFGDKDSNGTENMYIEDCTWRDIYSPGALDADDCARVVVRHCVIENSGLASHGITSMWGGRAVEIYQNQIRCVKRPPNSAGIAWCNVNRYYWLRGGTVRIWGNEVEAIQSEGTWGGGRPSWVFTDEPLSRPGAGNGAVCETESQYPGTRWAGTGSDGTKHPSGVVVSPSVKSPVYIWDNTGSGASEWSTLDHTGYNCNGGATAHVFKEGRDIIFAAAPNYTPFPYPHPLRAEGSAPTPTPPVPTPTPPVPTPTPQPSATPTPAATYEQWIEKQNTWIRENPPTPDH